MRYMFLIYDDETSPMGEDPATFAEYGKFTALVSEKGVLRAGDPLQPTATSTTVRIRDGNAITTDGPFAETKEQLGGYYILDCKDLDEALQYAAKIPSARFGSIEVRPILDMSPG